MLNLDSLNPQQKQAVEQIHGSLMILAGAGTGKTRVITYRIAHMLQKGIFPNEIVALTFTNKAAKEMSERLVPLAGAKGKKVLVSTFHSFCLRMLRTHNPTKKPFNLAGSSEQLDMVRRSLEEKGWSGLYKPQEILSHISIAKNHLLRPKDLLSGKADLLPLAADEKRLLAATYPLYERLLKLNHAIDFDDCLFNYIELLQNHPEVKLKIENTLKYFLVDEFQDTNRMQLEALRLTAQNSQNVCVVGDDDQSIYSWRGADPAILEHFEKIFPGTKLIKLEQNYRCPSTILHAANTLIKHNQNRKDKSLWSQIEHEKAITVSQNKNEVEEASFIARSAFGLLGQGASIDEIAVLYRTNGQAKALEVALREANLPYKVYGGQSFFEKKEVKDFLSYFKLSLTPWDRLSFWRIINTPPRGIGLKTQELIESAAQQDDITPLKAAVKIASSLTKSKKEGIHYLSLHLNRLSQTKLQTPQDVKERAQEILKLFPLENDIRLRSPKNSQDKKINSLNSLPVWLEKIAQTFTQDGYLDVQTMIDHLTLSDESKNQKDRDQSKTMSLMTIHSAKGLEFPYVFLCGLEEELMPHKNSETTGAIDEERRLFYVALTRAKKQIFLSFSRDRSVGPSSTTRKPSRFLGELPETGIEMAAAQPPRSHKEKVHHNSKRLGNLRDKIKSGFM